MKDSKVAIIICTYNQEKLLQKCLESLYKKTNYKNYKVFFVDDSGKGEIGKFVKKKFKKADVTINKKNLGFSGANNVGIKKALKNYKPDYVLLLNDDTEIIEKNWLKKMVEVGEKDKKIGILGCRVLNPNKSLQWPLGINEKNKEIKEVGEVIGCCLMFKKEVSKKIGLLDEKFNPVYGEESDFCFRAKKAGFKILYTPNSKIIHYGHFSTKTIFPEKIWYLQKKHGIRLEWLNYGIFKIIKYTIIHFGSAILHKNVIKRLKLLLKAYKENIKNYKEIKQKRKERNSWLN